MILDGDLGKLPKEQKDHLGTMLSVVKDLSGLVSMILDVSRIQLGKMKVVVDKTNLDQILNEILEVMIPKANERKVIIDVNKPKQIDDSMMDKRLTNLIIINLLSNAVKYSPDESTVKLDIKTVDEFYEITVSDNGIGIPKSEHHKVFGKLYRASNTGAIDGNGFGLYAVKGATESLGGSIRFESEENKGTTFYVRIPINTHEES